MDNQLGTDELYKGGGRDIMVNVIEVVIPGRNGVGRILGQSIIEIKTKKEIMNNHIHCTWQWNMADKIKERPRLCK